VSDNSLALLDTSFMRTGAQVACPGCGKANGGLEVTISGLALTLSCAMCVARAEAEAEEQERQERVRDLLARAGGTARLEQFTLEGYPTTQVHQQALAKALGWRDRVLSIPPGRPGAPNLVLFGGIGSGKSGLMWPVVRSLCEHLRRTRYVDFPALLEQMKDAYAKRVPFDQFSELGRVPVLVLDDVGAERPTEWALGELLQLVNARYERLLPTAYISNFEPQELVARLGRGDEHVGERIVSRMNEGAIQCRLKSRDLRAA
jgi:DNA replication protein DnaC